VPNDAPHSTPAPPTEAAAAYYRDRLGWPVRSTRTSVWLPLSGPLLAVAVPEHLTCRLAISGPAINCPGDPAYRVFLTCGITTPDRSATALFRARGVIQLGIGRLLDLPPTEVIPGPLAWDLNGSLIHPDPVRLTWSSAPEPSGALASFTAIIDALRGDAKAS
jgi:hypothetical protein